MRFTIHDRLILQTILPTQGNFLEMTLVVAIKDKIEFIPKEIEDYEIKNNEAGIVSWNVDKAKDLELGFLQTEKDMIVQSLNTLDEKKDLTSDHLKLYRRFVIDKEGTTDAK